MYHAWLFPFWQDEVCDFKADPLAYPLGAVWNVALR